MKSEASEVLVAGVPPVAFLAPRARYSPVALQNNFGRFRILGGLEYPGDVDFAFGADLARGSVHFFFGGKHVQMVLRASFFGGYTWT